MKHYPFRSRRRSRSPVPGPGRHPRLRVRLRTRMLLLQCVVVVAVLASAFGAFAYDTDQRLVRQYQQRALAIARTVASEPTVRAGAARYSRTNDRPGQGAAHESSTTLAANAVRKRAETVRKSTGSLFVVVTDDRGIRLAHPDVSELGKKVSTAPSRALSGREELAVHRAHLGEEVVAKVPVRAPGLSRVVGEANVGVSVAAVHAQAARVLWGGVGWLVAALLLGIGASVLLARRWKRLTLGLEPEELAGLVQEQEAVVHGIGEGVLAVDGYGRVTVANDEVRRLLGTPAEPGTRLDRLGLTPRVLEVVSEPEGRPVMAVVGERVLVVSARRVERDGLDLGTLLTVKDRTDVESLTRQLDAVQTMSSALRAQRHEFANRLHVLSGLLHQGHTEQAADYIDSLLGTGGSGGTSTGTATSIGPGDIGDTGGSGPLEAPGAALPGLDTVKDPYLSAILSAKAAQARELGVTLLLGGATWVDGPVTARVDLTTVLGNLIDNALDAARDGTRRPPRVEVELMTVESDLHITVADSGDGVPAELAGTLFEEGISTKDHASAPGGRGVGLSLIRQIARGRGGDIRLTDPGGPPTASETAEGAEATDLPGEHDRVTGGAVFVARLPHVVRHPDTLPAKDRT
ncbi:sensor histidine kinase [Streptomyces sp. NPDC047117]|uniref:sensor histidine kinase n=1 Tax=Streptomyces sp. NPDC047117 TaxID=3155379 RepID=UPI0033D875B0